MYIGQGLNEQLWEKYEFQGNIFKNMRQQGPGAKGNHTLSFYIAPALWSLH